MSKLLKKQIEAALTDPNPDKGQGDAVYDLIKKIKRELNLKNKKKCQQKKN